MNLKKTLFRTVMLMTAGCILCTAASCKRTSNQFQEGALFSAEVELMTLSKEQTELYGFDRNITFPTVNEMLLSLRSGRIDMCWMPEEVARYIAANNDGTVVLSDPNPVEVQFKMAVLPDNQMLCQKLSRAIEELQADGTLEKLRKQWIFDLNGKRIPPDSHSGFGSDGEVVSIGITGDLPPLDYISSNGKPSGFNAALLEAIGKKAKLRFKCVPTNSGSRFTALFSGKINAVFWIRDYGKAPVDEGKLLVTKEYFKSRNAILCRKGEEVRIRNLVIGRYGLPDRKEKKK